MKRSSNDSKLGDVIRELIRYYHLDEKLHEIDYKKYWERVCGPMIVRHTVKMYINKRKLFVRLDSAALKNELTMSRTLLTDSLNKEAGEKIIDEVVFL